MADPVVADRHIGDNASRAEIAFPAACLTLGGEQDSKSHLRETAPNVLHPVALKENALGIFQFEEILNCKWISVVSAYVAGLPFHPGQGFEIMIACDPHLTCS